MVMTQGMQNLSKTLIAGIPKGSLQIMGGYTKMSKTRIKGDVQMRQFTDTEMLDWIIDNRVLVWHAGFPRIYWVETEYYQQLGSYPTPREAITSEMNRENNNG